MAKPTIGNYPGPIPFTEILRNYLPNIYVP